MSKISWTKEQQMAISERDKSLLVSASAGSGKTTVMIERIIELMLGVNAEKTPITNFLIVTFTKASATDMKKKLVDKLLEIPANEYVLDQIEDVSIADISDLHSFYSKLISTYFYEVDIDPSYKIVDADESVNLKEKAISKLFEEKEKQGDETYFKLFDIFQKKRKDTALKDTIYRLNDFLNSIIDGENWFKKQIIETCDTNIQTNACANLINFYVTENVAEEAKVCDEFAEKCAKLGCDVFYEYFTELSSLIRSVRKENSYLVNAKNISEIDYPRAKRCPKEFEFLKEESEKIKKQVKAQIANFKANYVSCDKEELEKGLQTIRENLEGLFELSKEFNVIYSKFKKDVNGLDFNDLEKYALKILQNDAIRKAVQDKYKYVFVDEYQDINEVQEKIISLVSKQTNRFMVGDIKQSIYRFRHCDPEIFIGKSKEYTKIQDYAMQINLNCNFRSDKKILKFVDLVFSGVMTENFGGVNYEKESQFVAGEKNLDLLNSVNLCYIDSSKQTQEKVEANGVYSVKNHEQELEEDAEKAVAEANYVALKISELVDIKQENPMQYSDIAILVQSRNEDTLRFLDTLRCYGIPIASDEKYDLMTRNYTQEIINFIELACARQNDILLFKVLKSKLFGFSDSELVEIRKLDMCTRFYDVILLYEKLDNVELKLKVQYFESKLAKFRELASRRTLQEVARQVVKEFELDKINLFDTDGQKFNDEIDKFISRLPNKSAYEFLINYPNFSMVFENECAGNAVNVMTIHKSKGIEFKAVFVINNSKLFNVRGTNDMIIFNKTFGAGMDYFDVLTRTRKSSIPIEAIRIFETNKLIEEKQRLLYVALTRAKEKLFVVCSKAKKALNREIPRHKTAFINWFESIIVKELEGEHNNIINFESYDIGELLDVPEKEQKQVLFSDEKVDVLEAEKYAYQDSIGVPLKNSISKLIQKNQNNYALNSDDEYENYRFSDKVVSAVERGTIYHKLFQFINLKNRDNIDNEINNAKELLLKNEQEIIDETLVKKVLNLDFFAQINDDDIILKEREFYAKMPAKMYNEKASQDDDFIMQGVIDLLIVQKDGAILLDYKTGKLSDEKLENYTYQLNAYADVCERAIGIKIKSKFLCFIDLQKIIEI